MSRINRTVSRPPSDGPSYSPDSLPAYRGGSQAAEPPAPSFGCAITLTTEFNAAFGISEAQIDGQRVFIDNVGSDGTYSATTDLDNPRPLWSSGTRWIEMQDLQRPSEGLPFLSFISPDGANQFKLYRAQNGNWAWEVSSGGVPQDTVFASGSDTDNVGLGISANGDLRAIRNGSEVSLTAAFDGFWATDVALYAGFQSVTAGASGSHLIATCSGNYNNDYSGISGDNFDLGGTAL